MGVPSSDVCKLLISLHVLFGSQGTDADEIRLHQQMEHYGVRWNDWPEIFVAVGVSVGELLPLSKDHAVAHLHAAIGSSDEEAKVVLSKLHKKLNKLGLSWISDLPKIIVAEWAENKDSKLGGNGAKEAAAFNVFALVYRLLDVYVTLTPEQRIVGALIVLHTHVYNQFQFTPRLGLISPLRRFGKTTLLILLCRLVARGFRPPEDLITGNISAAALFHDMHENPGATWLLDECDKSPWFRDPSGLATFNDGYRRGANTKRFWEGRVQKFNTYAPVIWAAKVPIYKVDTTLLDRSILFFMQRRARDPNRKKLNLLDPGIDAEIEAVHQEICKWKASASLTQEPEVPVELNERAGDICIPLLSIAENLRCAEEARKALVTLYASRPDDDPQILLLRDAVLAIRAGEGDYIRRDDLLPVLHELETGRWTEFCGVDGKALPHKLREGEMVAMLGELGVRTKNRWPSPRLPGAKSFKVFLRSDLEKAWEIYGPSGATSSQPTKVVQLRRP
jgi:hypothetical protein